MSWRFRRSFKIIPGVKLNLSRSGLTASIGGAPFTVNLGKRGIFGTASLPGTGIAFRQKLTSNTPTTSDTPTSTGQVFGVPDSPNQIVPPASAFLPPTPTSATSVQSASTELLTSGSLRELKALLHSTSEEREEIDGELSRAVEAGGIASQKYLSWSQGFFLKRICRKQFREREEAMKTAAAKISELNEQLQLTTIATQVEMADEQREFYFKMRDTFSSLGESARIWDIKSYREVDTVRERTIAGKTVAREAVAFALGASELLHWDQNVPHLQNANGGDMFLYPGFLLYRASKQAFSIIDYHDVQVTTVRVHFHETEGVPKDSSVVGHTWTKANKDGSPDRRFANNQQIPIALYGMVTFRSKTGLWEEFMVSNLERISVFVQAWNIFSSSFAKLNEEDDGQPRI